MAPGSRWLITPELAPERAEVTLTKTSRSAFTSTGTDQILRNLGMEHWAVGGFATNGCVELSARDAADCGYETFLVEDDCAVFHEHSHLAVLDHFGRLDGAVLTTTPS